MVLELRQSPKLAQQLVMTPQLQQAIKLLQLSTLELEQAIREELEVNPVLEEVAEGAPEDPPTPETRAPDVQAAPEEPPASQDNGLIDRIDWDYYFGDSGHEERAQRDPEEDEGSPRYENTLTRQMSLFDHLETQVQLLDIPEPIREAAHYLIGNIDENGYLNTTVEEAAAALSMTADEISRALAAVQTLDPSGVGARDLRECLLIQAMEKGEEFALSIRIISEHFDLFSKGDIAGLSRKLKLPKEMIKEALQKLATLWPRPGKAYSGEEVQYITPDVRVFKMDGKWVVDLNDDGQPRLRLSSYYRSLLVGGGRDLPKEGREYLKQKVNSALWFIKSIEQRKRTIYKVVTSIVKLQFEFFERGIKHLRPLTLKDVAEDIEMHESTVSRVTSGKYVDTPHGVFELKYFFNSGLNRGGGEENIASKSVKEKIKEIIRAEGENRRMSDQELVGILQSQGIQIARRTVTKYRAQLGLLSSSGRRRQL